MTKQEVIEKAYGDKWEQVKHLVREYDGTIEIFPYLMDDGHEDDGFFWKTLGYKHEEIEDVYGDCEASRWRPISLSGIENNNGWIKINSHHDLPDTEGDYIFMDHTGCSKKAFFTNDKQCLGYYTRLFSHWKHYNCLKPLY